MVNYAGIYGLIRYGRIEYGAAFPTGKTSTTGGINRLVLKKKYLKKYPEVEEQVEAVLPVIEFSAKPDYSVLNKWLSDADKRAKYFAQLQDDDETFFILD